MHLSGKNPVRKPGCESFYGNFARRYFARQRVFARGSAGAKKPRQAAGLDAALLSPDPVLPVDEP
jgi:hypothetical protein